MSIVRTVYPADWRNVVITVAVLETPKGRENIRFIYDKRTDKLFFVTPEDKSFHQLGLSRAKVNDMLRKVLATCRWRVKKSDDDHRRDEELKRLRRLERERRKKAKSTSAKKKRAKPKSKKSKNQLDLPF